MRTRVIASSLLACALVATLLVPASAVASPAGPHPAEDLGRARILAQQGAKAGQHTITLTAEKRVVYTQMFDARYGRAMIMDVQRKEAGPTAGPAGAAEATANPYGGADHSGPMWSAAQPAVRYCALDVRHGHGGVGDRAALAGECHRGARARRDLRRRPGRRRLRVGLQAVARAAAGDDVRRAARLCAHPRVRLSALPILLQVQPAFEGTRSVPIGTSGVWMRATIAIAAGVDL